MRKAVKLGVVWCLLGLTGYIFGRKIPSYVSSDDLVVLVKAMMWIFSLATVSFGFVFKLSDESPPELLDDERKERWISVFDQKWKLLWVRVTFLLLAAGVCRFSIEILKGKFSLLSDEAGRGLAAGAILVGIVAAILSILDVFKIRKEVEKSRSILREKSRKRELLEKLEGPPTNDSSLAGG